MPSQALAVAETCGWHAAGACGGGKHERRWAGRTLRFIALKNICSDGYTHTGEPGCWCVGAASGAAAMGMEDAWRLVDNAAACSVLG
jgi:hypothetical protein